MRQLKSLLTECILCLAMYCILATLFLVTSGFTVVRWILSGILIIIICVKVFIIRRITKLYDKRRHSNKDSEKQGA